MARNKKHIPQKPEDQYPKPDVSADDAWMDMRAILDSELPVDGETRNPQTPGPNWLNYILAISGVIFIAGILFFAVYEKRKTDHSATQKLKNTISLQPNSSSSNHQDIRNSSELAASKISATDSIPNKNLADREISIGDQNEKNSSASKFCKEEELEAVSKYEHVKATTSISKHQKSETKTNLTAGKQTHKTASTNRAGSLSTETSSPTNIGLSEKYGHTQISLKQAVNASTGNFSSNGSIAPKRQYFDIAAIKSPEFGERSILAFRLPHILTVRNQPLIIKDSTNKNYNRSFWHTLHAGLLWNAAIPFNSETSMFLQANGKKGILPIIVPGIWISRDFGAKNSALIWGKLYNQHFSNDLIQRADLPTTDSTGYINERYLLVNQSFQVGLQFNQTVYKKIQLGVGVTYNHSQKILERRKSVRYPNNFVLTDTVQSSGRSSYNSLNIKHSYLSGRIEAAYVFGKLKTGVALTIPLTSLTDSVKARPVNGQIFLRWQIK